MTVNVARRTRRRVGAPAGAAADRAGSLAIGEIDQTVFDCPRCARPLTLGTRRCPGCRTRLISGIPLATAATIASLALALGVLAGAGGGYLVGRQAAGTSSIGDASATAGDLHSSARPSDATGAGVTPSASPSPTAAPSADAGIPPAARAALTQAVATNARLAVGADALQVALGDRVFDAPVVARTLRAMSADSVYGEQLAARLAAWPGSADAAGALTALYETVHENAAEALVASVKNGVAYRTAARTMLDDLAGLSATDAALREIAAANGVNLADAPEASLPAAPTASAAP